MATAGDKFWSLNGVPRAFSTGIAIAGFSKQSLERCNWIEAYGDGWLRTRWQNPCSLIDGNWGKGSETTTENDNCRQNEKNGYTVAIFGEESRTRALVRVQFAVVHAGPESALEVNGEIRGRDCRIEGLKLAPYGCRDTK